jgi:hypothetical protein
MPFVSSAQRRACFYKRKQAQDRGETPEWDCDEFAKIYISGRYRRIHKTLRGAKYVIVNGQKRYVYNVY